MAQTFATPSPGPVAPFYQQSYQNYNQAPSQRSAAQVYYDRMAEAARMGTTVSPQEAAGYGIVSNPVPSFPTFNNYTPYVAPKTGGTITNTVNNPPPTTQSTVAGAQTTQTIDPLAADRAYIDQNYQGALDTLSGQFSNAQSDYGRNQGLLNQQYSNYGQQLGTGRQNAMDLNQRDRLWNERSQQSAIDMANNTYQQLQQQNRQMYGGSSSAGQFGNELQGRTLQQGVNQATQQGQDNLNSLMKQSSDIETNYQSSLQDMNLQKSRELSDLESQFNTIKSQIDSQRAGIGGDKANANYQLLKGFRDEQKSIEQKWTDLRTQMDMNNVSAKQQLQASLQQYNAQLGKPIDLNAIDKIALPSYLPQIDQNTGQVTTYPGKRKYDPKLGY